MIINLVYTSKKNNVCAVIKHYNNSYSLVPLTHGLFIGSFVYNYFYSGLEHILLSKLGSVCFLEKCKIGYFVSNLKCSGSIKNNYAVSSGTFCFIFKKDKTSNSFFLFLPSGSLKKFPLNTIVTLGKNFNFNSDKWNYGKAGLSRLYNNKSKVRGVAMNPVDHPNGGRSKTFTPELSP